MSKDKKNKPLQDHAAATDNTNTNDTKNEESKQEANAEPQQTDVMEYDKKARPLFPHMHYLDQCRVKNAHPFTLDMAEKIKQLNQYEIHNGQIWEHYTKKNGDEVQFLVASTPIYKTERLENITTDETYWRVTWYDAGRWKERVISAENLKVTNKITELTKYNFPVTSETAKRLIGYLENFEYINRDVIPIKNGVEQLGYHKNGFLLGESFFGVNEGTPPLVFIPRDTGEKQYASYYKAEGTAAEWKESLFDILKPHPKALIYVIMSFSSVLLKPLRIEKPIIVDLSGTTSKGKTTTMLIAATVWGEPYKLMGKWNSTRVDIERKLFLTKHLPYFLDDTKSVPDERHISKLIYAISTGEEKGRGSIKGSRAVHTYQNIVFSTGEKKITEFSKDAGQSARVLSMHGNIYDEQADELMMHIEERMVNQYGTAGREFIKHVLQQDAEQWKEYRALYHSHVKKCTEAAAGNNVVKRQAKAMALAITTAELLNKWMDYDIDIDSLYDEWNNEIVTDNQEEADRPKQALSFVYDWALRNRSKFYYEKTTQALPAESLGEWTYTNEHWGELRLNPSALYEFLEKQGFDSKTIVKEWRQRGYIAAGNNRLTKKCRTFLGKRDKQTGDISLGKGDWFVVIKRSAIDSLNE